MFRSYGSQFIFTGNWTEVQPYQMNRTYGSSEVIRNIRLTRMASCLRSRGFLKKNETLFPLFPTCLHPSQVGRRSVAPLLHYEKYRLTECLPIFFLNILLTKI